MWGSGQNSKGAMRPCPSAYEKHKVLEKTRSIQFLRILWILWLDIDVCRVFWGVPGIKLFGHFPIGSELSFDNHITCTPVHLPSGGEGGSIKFPSKRNYSHDWERNLFPNLLTLPQTSTWFQQDSHLLTLLPCLHWMSWAFTSWCHYHATKTHLWQVTVQPSHFS